MPPPDGLDPGVSLLSAGGTDGVGLMLPLHHPSICLGFTRLDLLPWTVEVAQFQTVLQESHSHRVITLFGFFFYG